MNKLVAVVGMCGSGKSLATDILVGNGWHKVYFGGVTYKKMEEEGIIRTPDSEKKFREKLREMYGQDCYAKLLLPEIEEELKTKNVVLDGLYSWHEYKFLENIFKDNLKLICIITDKKIRYDRIANRVERLYNSDEVVKRDLSEIENLDKGGPIAFADYYIFNNGSIDEYKTRLYEILEQI